jgi:hypothetical protein
LLVSLKKGSLETVFRIWQIISLIPPVEGASCLLMDLGDVSLNGECDLGVSASTTPADHGDKEYAGESWDKVSRVNTGMVCRQAKEQDTGGRGRRLWTHGSHRKERSSLRAGAMATKVGAFSFLGYLWQQQWSSGHGV